MAKSSTTDRRIIRTDHAIRRALVELVEEKGFDAVTVRDIVSRADINRGTFYLHYKDKYDLVEQIEEEAIRDLENIVKQANSLNYNEINASQPPHLIIEIFQYIKENMRVARVLFSLKGEFDFQTRIWKTIQKNLEIGFLSIVKTAVPLVPTHYLITYVLSAHVGVVKAWINGGCAETPQEIAGILSKLSIDGPLHAIRFPDMDEPNRHGKSSQSARDSF